MGECGVTTLKNKVYVKKGIFNYYMLPKNHIHDFVTYFPVRIVLRGSKEKQLI